jgi:hypothetical protein
MQEVDNEKALVGQRIEQVQREIKETRDAIVSWERVIWQRTKGAKKFANHTFTKRKATLYVCRKVLNAPAIARWAKQQGFDTTLDPSDMHVTIAYSKRPVTWPEPRSSRIELNASQGRSVKQFGEGAVVLTFDSALLNDRWRQFRQAGASWDHPEYRPHITISYRLPPDVDIRTIKPYTGPITLGEEEFEEVDTDKEHVEKAREVFHSVERNDFMKRAHGTAPPNYRCGFVKADSDLGLVFGWAIVSSDNGEPYYDTQGDHIPEDAMVNAAAEFMLSRRAMKIMHAGKKVGTVVFAWPMTEEIARAMGVRGKRTGLMIAVKPDSKSTLDRFRNGQYTGFSIGGNRLIDEAVID